MRRYYAFEAEGVSDEVKSQLEIAEDAVEDKCETAEDCDEMMEKIDGQIEKFDDALKTMSDAAKDCKDGKCDKDEMAEKITPAMAELKEVAKTIGVAKEGDEGTVTEAELKDVKDYLEGAKEIVEAKKDEIESGENGDSGKSDDDDDSKSESESDKDDDDDDEDDDVGEEDEEVSAEEAFMDGVIDTSLDECTGAIESCIIDAAMEGTNADALSMWHADMKTIRAMKTEMNRAKQAKDFKTAAAKAREIAKACDKLYNDLDHLPPSLTSTMIVTMALALAAIAAAAVVGKVAGNVYNKKANAHEDKAFKAAASGENGKNAYAKAYEKGAKQSKAKRTKLLEDSVKDLSEDQKEMAYRANSSPDAMAYNLQTDELAGKSVAGDLRSKRSKSIGAQSKGISAAIPAGGAVATALPIIALLRGKKVIDADGNATRVKLNANDMNVMIMAMKKSVKNTKKMYEEKARRFDDMVNQSHTAYESIIFDDAMEDYLDDVEYAVESVTVDIAMEGTNIDALHEYHKTIGDIRVLKKAMNNAKRTGDYKTAAAKARDIASKADELSRVLGNLPNSVTSAAIVGIALTVAALLIVGGGAKAATKAIGTKGALAKGAALEKKEYAARKAEIKEGIKKTVQSNGKEGKSIGTSSLAKQLDEAKDAAASARNIADTTNLAKVGKAAKVAGAVTGGVAAAGAAGSQAVACLKSRKLIDADGNAVKKPLESNDFNMLLVALKADCKRLKSKYTELATQFDSMAKGAESYFDGQCIMTVGEESFDIFTEADEYCEACESLGAVAEYMAMEGARGINKEAKKVYKERFRNGKSLLKQAKTYAKGGDVSNAKRCIEEGCKTIEDGMKELERLGADCSIGDVSNGNAMVAGLLGLFPGTANPIRKKAIQRRLDDLNTRSKVNGGQEITPGELNGYIKGLGHDMRDLLSEIRSSSRDIMNLAERRADKRGKIQNRSDMAASVDSFIAGIESLMINSPSSSSDNRPFFA